jgi:hypothetical protein
MGRVEIGIPKEIMAGEACARCDFYLPKGSTQAQLLEAKGNVQRMLASIPLTDGPLAHAGASGAARRLPTRSA